MTCYCLFYYFLFQVFNAFGDECWPPTVSITIEDPSHTPASYQASRVTDTCLWVLWVQGAPISMKSSQHGRAKNSNAGWRAWLI